MANAYFDGQRDDEEIVAVWRRNPATFLREGVVVLIASLIILLSFRMVGASIITSLLIGLWLVFVPIYVGIALYRWWNDLYVLTTQRLVDVDQRGLFHRAVAEAPLENVQDVSFEVRGIVQTVLNYGSVLVQTASVTTQISIEGVTDPQAIQQTILRATHDHKHGKRSSKVKQAAKPVRQLG